MFNSTLRRAALAVLAGLMLGGCASLVGPRQIELPQAKLQQELERRFPLHQRALEMFDVELARPLLSIDGNSGRVALQMEVTVSPPLMRQTWHGSLTLSGRLALDPARNVVYINEARVDRFVIDGGDDQRQRQLAKVANLLLDTAVKEVTLYRFRPDDLHYAGMRFAPTRVETRTGAIVVTVEPAR
jgi:hypothetical protein